MPASAALPRLVAVALAGALLAACGAADHSQPEAAPTASTSGPTTGPTATTAGAAPVASEPACHRSGPVDRDVTYRSVPPGADPRAVSLDVHRLGPGCSGAPIWLWVHGGGWTTGDKANRLDDKVDLARSRGWVLVSVDYRLSPGTPSVPVAWPDHDDDVAAAVAWVHDHAASIGGDPARLLLSGHSAGGGITAAVAGDPRYLAAVGLTPAAIRCAAVFDTEGYDVVAGARARSSAALYRQAFGTDPDDWEAASPIRHLASDGSLGDQLVVTRGAVGRRSSAARYVAAVEAAGARATLVDAGGLSHAEVNAAIGRPGDTVVTPAFVAWAEACLAR